MADTIRPAPRETGCRTFSEEGASRSLRRLGRTGSRWLRATPEGRPRPRPGVIHRLRARKRKRTLYRRFLVSLGARRRIRTRTNRLRSKGVRHESKFGGVSRGFAPPQFHDFILRTIIYGKQWWGSVRARAAHQSAAGAVASACGDRSVGDHGAP